MGHDFIAKYRSVNANEEIFVDYGENWLDSREQWGYDKVPRMKDFTDGGKVLMLVKRTLAAGAQKSRTECANEESCQADGRDHLTKVEKGKFVA